MKSRKLTRAWFEGLHTGGVCMAERNLKEWGSKKQSEEAKGTIYRLGTFNEMRRQENLSEFFL